jgi:protoporphyrinogen oxidase
MAGKGRTVLVAEYFCFEGDEVWTAGNEELVDTTAAYLEELGFIDREEAGEGCVVRVPKAYPLFEVGYMEHMHVIDRYLGRFHNLHPIGRGGLFRYYNMDHAIESGLEAARKVLGKAPLPEGMPQPAVA